MNEIDIPAATIRIRHDGIMHIHIKVKTNFEIDHSKQVAKARTKISNNNPYPILYTATNLVIPSQEVREYVASKGRSKLVIADAFVVNSLPQRIMARFYRILNKPVRPTKYFNNPDDAIKWLRKYVKP